jgi:hypothetical protein
VYVLSSGVAYWISINKHWKGKTSFLQIYVANEVGQKYVTQTQAKLRVRGEIMLQVRSSNSPANTFRPAPRPTQPPAKWVPGLFPWVKRPGRGADQPLLLVPGSIMGRAIGLPLPPLCALLAWKRTAFPLPYLKIHSCYQFRFMCRKINMAYITELDTGQHF